MYMLKKDVFEQAYFLHQHALESSWQFMTQLKDGFKDFNVKIEGGTRNNLANIGQEIRDHRIKNEFVNPFRITDML